MEIVKQHICDTYTNRGWDGSGCQFIFGEGWTVMVDTDDGKIRIGAYEHDSNDEYGDIPTIWIEIPEDREGVAISTVDAIVNSLPMTVA